MADIKRIYEIEIQGAQDSLRELASVTAAFDFADERFKNLIAGLNSAKLAGDKGAIEDLGKQIADLSKSMDDLAKKKESLAKETLLLAKAGKTEAETNLANEKANLANAKAEESKARARKLANEELNKSASGEKTATDASKASTKAAHEEEEMYVTLQEQIKQLRIARERLRTEGTQIQFRGLDLTDNQAIKTIKELQAQINNLRTEEIDAITASMRNLEIETKQLTTMSFQLTAANREVGLSLSVEDFNQYKTILSNIIPEISQLTLADFNAGKAAEILNQKIFQNNEALRNFKREISGSNTLVGDYTKGIIDAFKNLGLGGILQKEKQDVDLQIRELITRINDLNSQWKAAFTGGAEGANKIEEELRQLGKQYAELTQKSTQFKSALESTAIGTQISGSISQGFKNLDRTIGQTLITYVGFQAAISGVSNVIRIDKQLSDQFADLQRTLVATTQETNNVVEALKNLDTRTSLTQLQGFAIIAAKAGVAADKIAGVASAINKLQLVSGNELGDIDTATTSIVKLINIFQGAGAVTEESVLRIGNAIVTLSNQGVASGRFLVNFSERLAGIEGATKISQASVFGLSAAFEETGQTAEIAATSVAQVLNKISQDVPKFAALAGKPLEEFRKLLQDNPAEALITLSQNLVKEGATIDEIGTAFEKVGITGVRVKTTFQDLGANAEFFRKRISDATLALIDQNVIMTGSEAKQQTFAATIDKIGAALTKAFDNKTFVNLLDSIAGSVLGLINVITSIPFSIVIVGISAMTAAWGLYKGQTIATALSEAVLNKQSGLNLVARLAERLGIIQLTAAQKLRQIALNAEIATQRLGNSASEAELLLLKQRTVQALILAGATEAEAEATAAAAIATRGLNVALATNPIGIVLAAIGLLIPLIGAFASKTDDASFSLSEENKLLKTNGDIQKRIHQIIQEETGKTQAAVRLLVNVIKDETLTVETRQRAYDSLIKIDKEFQGSIQITKDELGNEKITIIDLMDQYDKFIIKIQELARAKALAAIGAKAAEDAENADFKLFTAENELIEANHQKEISKQIADINKERLKQNKPFLTPEEEQALGLNIDVLLKSQSGDLDAQLAKAKADAKKAQDAEKLASDFVKNNIERLEKDRKDIIAKINQGNLTAEQLKDLTDRKNLLDEQINTALNIKQPPPGEGLTTDEQIKALEVQLKNKKEEVAAQVKIVEQFNRQGVLREQEKTAQHEANLKLDELRKERDAIIKKLKDLGAKTAGEGGAAGIISSFNQDDLRNIEAQRDRALTIEKTFFASIELSHKASFEEEKQHLEDEQEINDRFDRIRIQKIKDNLDLTISLKKNASGKQLAQLKEDQSKEELEIEKLNLGILTRQLQSNDKLQALRNKQFNEESKNERKHFEDIKAQIQLNFEATQRIPEVGFETVAVAQRKSHQDTVDEINKHYDKLIELAIKFRQDTESIENEKRKAIADITKQSLDDEKNVYDAYFKDIDRKFEKNISDIKDRLNTLRETILNQNTTTQGKFQQIEVTNQIEDVLSASEKLKAASEKFRQLQLDAAIAHTDAFEKLSKNFHKVTQEELNEARDNLIKSKEDLLKALDEINKALRDLSSLRGLTTFSLGKLFKFEISQEDLKKLTEIKKKIADGIELTDDEKAKFEQINQKIRDQVLLGDVIASAFDTAKIAMESFFESERNNIETNKKASEDRLSLEFEQRKARSQSAAESATLDRQEAAEKKKLDQQAGEDLKKVKLAEAKMALASELANIAVAAAANPLNGFTFGASGIIMYGILAGLALTRYALNASAIQSATFAEFGKRLFSFGGNPDRDTVWGGRVKGRSHSQGGNQFIFKGRVFEDEVDELNIIRTKNAPKGIKYKVEGTQEQIASFLNVEGGGISFAPGAIGKRYEFGGKLLPLDNWEFGGNVFNLQPPSNPSSFLNSNSNVSIERLEKSVFNLSSTINSVNNKVDKQNDLLVNAFVVTNNRIDRIRVENVATETTKKSDQIKKANNIGTLL